MIFYGLSDVGLHRQNNQDSFGYLKIAENAEIFVVCDGMGGANGGNIASRERRRGVYRYLRKRARTVRFARYRNARSAGDTDALGPLAETTEFFGIKSGADTDGEAESGKNGR